MNSFQEEKELSKRYFKAATVLAVLAVLAPEL